MNEDIPVLYCVTPSFALPFAVSLSSLLSTSPKAKVHVLVLPNDGAKLKEELFHYLGIDTIAQLNILEVSEDILQVLPQNWSKIGYLRLLSPQLFPQYDKMVYLDADTLILNNITELWETDVNDFMFAAARDSDCPDFGYDHQLFLNWGIAKGPYFNSGVMLLNLKYMRYGDFTNQVLEMFKNRSKLRFTFGDQDAMNVLFHSQWKEVKPNWNLINHARETLLYCQSREEFDPAFNSALKEAYSTPYIVHFAGGVNPWTFGTPTQWGVKWNEVRKKLVSDEAFSKWRSQFMASTLWKLAQFSFSDATGEMKEAIKLIYNSLHESH